MEYINVNDRLPETKLWVLCFPEKGIPFVGIYTKGREISYEDFDDDGEYDEIEVGHGSLYLKEGWYECEEQFQGEYDEYYMKRKVTHWMPLPNPPKH
jgi:hypothetical protein